MTYGFQSRMIRRAGWTCAAGLMAIYLAACGDGGKGGGLIGKTGTGVPVSVEGTVRYEDRTFDETGFTGKDLKPVRSARIEIVRESDTAILAAGSTGMDGSYGLTFTNDGPAGVYLSVLAQDAEGVTAVLDKNGNFHAIRSKQLDDTESDLLEVDLTATIGSSGGIFNILDVFLDGSALIRDLTGDLPPPLAAIWSSGSCDGTYYDPAASAIFILGGCGGDTDEYDDTVLLHEYAHFLASKYSRDDSPGGVHFLDDNTQDIRVSWSEGWGNFFSAAVRDDPLYVDTIGNEAAITFEIEELTSPISDLATLSDVAVYTTNELSVAAALWDILDESPQEFLDGGMDEVSAGFGPIWDVFSGYLDCTVCGLSNISFEHFWDGWFSLGYESSQEMQTLASSRRMVLSDDAFEEDDALEDAVPVEVDGTPQDRGIYPEGDPDFFRFEAEAGKTYTIETLNLTNGTDTRLVLLDSNGVEMDENDNFDGSVSSPVCGVVPLIQVSNCPPNDGTTLSSRVVLIAPFDATYYIRLDRSVNSPPSAGRYGGYQIRILSE